MRPVYLQTPETRMAGAERRLRFLERRSQIPETHPDVPAAGGGIQFETEPQAGGWLFVEATDSGGIPTTVGAGIELFSSGGAPIVLRAASLGGIQLVDGGYSGSPVYGSGGIQLYAGAGAISLICDGDINIVTAGGSGNYISITGLPTSNPGSTGRVWNDGGTLKIT